jgi:hypothetical protein
MEAPEIKLVTEPDLDPAIRLLAIGKALNQSDELRRLINAVLNKQHITPLLEYLLNDLKEKSYWIRKELERIEKEEASQ